MRYVTSCVLQVLLRQEHHDQSAWQALRLQVRLSWAGPGATAADRRGAALPCRPELPHRLLSAARGHFPSRCRATSATLPAPAASATLATSLLGRSVFRRCPGHHLAAGHLLPTRHLAFGHLTTTGTTRCAPHLAAQFTAARYSNHHNRRRPEDVAPLPVLMNPARGVGQACPRPPQAGPAGLLAVAASTLSPGASPTLGSCCRLLWRARESPRGAMGNLPAAVRLRSSSLANSASCSLSLRRAAGPHRARDTQRNLSRR